VRFVQPADLRLQHDTTPRSIHQAIIHAIPHQDMQLLLSSMCSKPITNKTTTSTSSISRSATLAITMTLQLQLQTKSKTRTKYRPIERADGVVVLQRPYRPASSLPAHAVKFEKHLPIFDVPTRIPTLKPQPKRRVVIETVEADFACIGAHLTGTVTEQSRVLGNEREELLGSLQDSRGPMAPMQRFLGGTGPWSVVERRGS
jgi:hypothetical protein